MNTFVNIFAEITEELHESLKNYLEIRTDWDLDWVFTSALSLSLIQNKNYDISQLMINQIIALVLIFV